MSRRRLRQTMLPLLLIVSLSTTASCASNGSSFGALGTAIKGESTTLTEAEKAEVEQAIRDSYPKFPYPSIEAIETIRRVNDPALNAWVQDLTILCRQLDKECNDAPR